MQFHDISLLLRSHSPIIVLQTHEEARAVDMLKDIALNQSSPIFTWSVATGMQRQDIDLEPQVHLKEPTKVLEHIKVSKFEAFYVLLDFHPFLPDPITIRLIKEVGMAIANTPSKLVLVSHRLEIPDEIKKMVVSIELALPDDEKLMEIVRQEASSYAGQHANTKVSSDRKVLAQLINNLKGLTYNDAKRLAHSAIFDDGAITESDLPEIMKAKYQLLSHSNLLAFEFETSQFADLAGMNHLKSWLKQRKQFFHQTTEMKGIDCPKGILLLGVQGCGKSVAAKAVAGAWKVPLLRMDFGRLYNKYIGESESNIREALKTAEVMSPCVLWIDELEKGISVSDNDDGTSQRILGTVLTWMAENKKPVFIVATSNAIDQLPPELIRKGRLDEVFFVDLPSPEVRKDIFRIHFDKREIEQSSLDLGKLAEATEGFSGSEIEQLVVSSIYSAHASNSQIDMVILQEEIEKTRPLSILMGEKIAALRQWAQGRTVPVN